MDANGRKIVVGVDGSEHSDRALAWAIDEAKLRNARIQVVTAWHVPALVYGGPGFAPQIDTSLEETFKEVAEESSSAAAEMVRDAGLEVDVAIEHGQAAETLIEAAEESELLVVGSRGHGGFTGLMLGSVSAQCAHHARCPLVIVR
jgi:nucleotide-binding universal stress UspA family protein